MTVDVGAGPELDRLIAEELFAEAPLCENPAHFEWNDHRHDETGALLTGTQVQPHARFSTTWEGAGLVVEAMRERGWFGSLQWDKDGWVMLFGHATDSRSAVAEASTAPHAVCLAAIEAGGEE